MHSFHIRITREGAAREQKHRLVSGVAELLQSITGENPGTTFVIIDEVYADIRG